MRCPICKAEGREHTLSEERVTQHVAMPVRRFYDTDDKLHIHDHEARVFVYSCSNGHHFRNRVMSRCTIPTCEWNDKPEVKNGQKTLEEIHAEASQKTE